MPLLCVISGCEGHTCGKSHMGTIRIFRSTSIFSHVHVAMGKWVCLGVWFGQTFNNIVIPIFSTILYSCKMLCTVCILYSYLRKRRQERRIS